MVPLVKAISCRVPHSGIRTGTRVSTITVRAKHPAGEMAGFASWEIAFQWKMLRILNSIIDFLLSGKVRK